MKSTKSPRWSRLDNTAKIFPPNSTPCDSKVFRFACELKEDAEPAVLQSALDITLVEFPFFCSVMKKGFFWYYLEESTLHAAVSPEVLSPCAPIYSANRKGLLFRVLYYGKRISLEVYHVLADGTGALQFFRTLVYHYLMEKYREDFSAPLPELAMEGSWWQKQDDGFQKYYEKPERFRMSRERGAHQLKGERLLEHRLGIVEGCMSLQTVLACSRSRNVTLTELMTAVLICAIHEEMSLRECRKPVVVTVPVNLRGYFPSDSARNFFSTINIGYDFGKQEDSLDAVLAEVKTQLRDKLVPDQLRERMNTFSAMEHSLLMRLVPLIIKDPVLRIANILAEHKTTASFSNVGKVTLPREMERYVNLFDVFASPNLLQATACSFKDTYVVSFAGPFYRHDVERGFFRKSHSRNSPIGCSSGRLRSQRSSRRLSVLPSITACRGLSGGLLLWPPVCSVHGLLWELRGRSAAIR